MYLRGSNSIADFGEEKERLEYKIKPSRANIQKKSVKSFTQEEFSRLHEGKDGVPVMLTDAVNHWPSITGEAKWTKDYLIDTAGLEDISINVQQGPLVGQFEQPMEDVLEHLDLSKHDKAFYTLTENFLYDVKPLTQHIVNHSIGHLKLWMHAIDTFCSSLGSDSVL